MTLVIKVGWLQNVFRTILSSADFTGVKSNIINSSLHHLPKNSSSRTSSCNPVMYVSWRRNPLSSVVSICLLGKRQAFSVFFFFFTCIQEFPEKIKHPIHQITVGDNSLQSLESVRCIVNMHLYLRRGGICSSPSQHFPKKVCNNSLTPALISSNRGDKNAHALCCISPCR